MRTRKISNLEVSVVGMGTMAFSHGYGQIPDQSYSIEAIRAAHEAGCTFFDTAEAYGEQLYWRGHNEQIVGKALAPVRDEVLIATKFHLSDDDVAAADLYAAMRAHLDASLERLGTDHVDLYYLHRFDERVAIDGAFELEAPRMVKRDLIAGEDDVVHRDRRRPTPKDNGLSRAVRIARDDHMAGVHAVVAELETPVADDRILGIDAEIACAAPSEGKPRRQRR